MLSGAQVVVQEDDDTALEHLLDLKAQHFHLGLLKVTKKDRRKPGRRKAEPEAEGRDAEAAGEQRELTSGLALGCRV